MDFLIHRRLSELQGTDYIEIGPGKYSKKHWQHGFLFISEYAFGTAEGIIARHFTNYDHFAPNDIPKNVGQKITADWAHVADLLDQMTSGQIGHVLNLNESFLRYIDSDIESHRADIAGMLRSLTVACDEFYRQGDWICILGM
jgi:hypothetical protein